MVTVVRNKHIYYTLEIGLEEKKTSRSRSASQKPHRDRSLPGGDFGINIINKSDEISCQVVVVVLCIALLRILCYVTRYEEDLLRSGCFVYGMNAIYIGINPLPSGGQLEWFCGSISGFS